MELNVTAADLSALATDVIVVGIFEGEKQLTGSAGELNLMTANQIKTHQADHEFDGKKLEVLTIHSPAHLAAKHLVVVGLGKKENFSAVVLRQSAAKAIQSARSLKAKHVAICLDNTLMGQLDASLASQMVTEGLLLGNYQFTRYKTTDKEKYAKRQIERAILIPSDVDVQSAIENGVLRGEAIATAILNARDIVNEPPSKIKPSHLAKAAQEIASLSKNIKATILDENALKKEGYTALLAVAAGSEEKPYLIHLHYKPVGTLTSVAFVGKGVTFDSGGLGIKPWNAMLNMKSDMAGGATVLGIFQALAELEALGQPIIAEVHGVIAATENMISGKAMRPDDVIETKNGKTIEVLHTDAEGRLILADALTYAGLQKPDQMVDFATLTGAAIAALGLDYSASMGNNEELLAAIETASRETGELVWRLPLPEAYKKYLESSVADLQNITPDREAPDAIYGGLFLQEFVGDRPWAHIDIAGPSMRKGDDNPVYPKGASGYGILLGLRLLELLTQK